MRRKVPLWAQSDKALMQRVIGPRITRRYAIADYYWRQNWSASRIAQHIGIKKRAVEKVIERLQYDKNGGISSDIGKD